MYNNDYKGYLNVLRTREVRPPFSEMARLVAAAPSRSPAVIPLFAKLAGALAIGSIITAGGWVISGKFHATALPHPSSIVNASSSRLYNGSYKSYKTHESYGSLAPKFVRAKSASLNFTISPNANAPLLTAPTDNNPSLPICPCAIQEEAGIIQPIAEDTRTIVPIAISSSDETDASNFFSTVGGAISQQFTAPFQQTSFSDAFLGIGYSLSQNASVRIIAGEEVFSAPSSTTINSISFHDTTLGSYQNVLGEIQSVNTPALTRIYWLGASYRYTLGDLSNSIRPFAEVMAGGSTNGFLTHQSLGAEYIVSDAVDLDLTLESSELLPQNSSWLTKAGFSAAISYRW